MRFSLWFVCYTLLLRVGWLLWFCGVCLGGVGCYGWLLRVFGLVGVLLLCCVRLGLGFDDCI